MKNNKKLILGSGSKGRLDLMIKTGFKPDMIISPDIDESFSNKEKPNAISARLTKEKGNKVFEILQENSDHHNKIIVSGDTVVAKGRRIIDKTLSDDEVMNAMKILSGSSHRIYSSIFGIETDNNGKIINHFFKQETTRIKFKNLSTQEIDDWVKSKHGIGNAGGYSLNHFAESFVIKITGSISNVIGVPTYHLKNGLLSLGLKPNYNN